MLLGLSTIRQMLKKGSRTLIVFFRVYLFIYFFDSGPVLFLSIREKDMRGKNQWSQFFVGLLSSFTKNNQPKTTHCGKEIIKQGKAVCRLESMKELLEEEIVNCTTSLEREELNKRSDLFSQSLSRAKGVCPDTPCLYSSPKLLKGESHSWCSKHFSETLGVFSSPNCSPSGQEMNSVSLSSCSNHSLLSSSSSPLRLVETNLMRLNS